jgi:hypothetical protein
VNVLLVANNPDVNPPSFGFDMYVHFNTMIHWGKTPFDKSIVAVRKNARNAKMRSFHYNKNEYIHVPTEKIIAVGWRQDVLNINPNIPMIALESVPDYPRGYSPTSGFAAIYHYVSGGHDVTVCGFDLAKADYYKTTGMHLPDYETGKIEKMIDEGIVARY